MIVNVMEQHVKDAYHRLKAAVKSFEDSAEHLEDVVVYALNRLPPKYVVSVQGKAVTEASLDAPQHRTEIDVKVIEAMNLVARVPRRPSRPAALG